MTQVGRNGSLQRSQEDQSRARLSYLKDKSRASSPSREQQIGQHIGYRYDVNLVPDYDRLTPYLKEYIEFMGWDDLNWLEDVHMGYEDGEPAIFDSNSMAGCASLRSEASGQSAGSRHDGERASGQIPDVAQPSHGSAQQSLPQGLNCARILHVRNESVLRRAKKRMPIGGPRS